MLVHRGDGLNDLNSSIFSPLNMQQHQIAQSKLKYHNPFVQTGHNPTHPFKLMCHIYKDMNYFFSFPFSPPRLQGDMNYFSFLFLSALQDYKSTFMFPCRVMMC